MVVWHLILKWSSKQAKILLLDFLVKLKVAAYYHSFLNSIECLRIIRAKIPSELRHDQFSHFLILG